MRRLVAALIVVLLALSLAGCGGGGEEPTAQPTTAPPAAPPTPTSQDVQPIPDRSQGASETFEPFRLQSPPPAAVAERLRTRQAMLLFFYDSSQQVTDDLRDQIDDVVAENRGLIDLIAYDLGKYASVDASGVVKIDPRLEKDQNAQQAARFAREVGVDHLPYTVIVDDQGYRIFSARGFIDAQLLERQVQRASR